MWHFWQPLLLYGKALGRLLAPDSDKHALFKDGPQDGPYPNTNSTTIIGCNPPNLAQKKPGDLIRLTFDVTNLNKLTMLHLSGTNTLNVFVPFTIIAAATGQHNLVPSFHHLRKFFQLSLIPCVSLVCQSQHWLSLLTQARNQSLHSMMRSKFLKSPRVKWDPSSGDVYKSWILQQLMTSCNSWSLVSLLQLVCVI